MQPEIELKANRMVEDLPGERWRGIPGLEDHYQVSDHGRVKRLAGKRPAQLIAPAITRSRNAYTGDTRYYVNFILWRDQTVYHFSAARLVYYCFVQEFDLKDRNLFIFYKDDDTRNLYYTNLILGDQAAKAARMAAAGRKGKPFGNISPEQRKAIQEKINAVKQQKGTYRISRYSLSGKLIETYPNAEVAAQAMQTNAHTLSKAARHDQLHTAKGYLWQRGDAAEIDIGFLTKVKGIQKSPAVKHLKRLGQYDLEGKLIATYSSIREASKKLKLGFNHISSCVNGKKLTYGGFIWRWGIRKKISVQDLPENKGYRYSPLSAEERRVSQYKLDGIWLRTFKTIAEAHRETGVDDKGILRCTQGKAITAGGYLWRRGTRLRIKTAPLTKLPAYQNSALQRYHREKRRAAITASAC